ncbi:MAG: hypothetical protein AB7R89_30520 [Dehalococcoidia bacterium]
MIPVFKRWQSFTQSPLGARLAPLYATLLGAALGALVADQLVRSMWHHAIFTGANQWRTVALLLTILWIAIGAVAALAILGPPRDDHIEGAPNPIEEAVSGRPDRAPHGSTT